MTVIYGKQPLPVYLHYLRSLWMAPNGDISLHETRNALQMRTDEVS